MGKSTKSGARPEGQNAITSFFKRDKPTAQPEASSDADNYDDDNGDDELQEAPSKKKKGTKSEPTKKTVKDVLDPSFPPINEIPKIFADLVSRVPKIKEVAEHVAGRKLRVATMCSGTESPLLALEMIQQSIQDQFDVKLDVQHVFSCEIEPFKQAYIERNFHPPILFRDVCELGDEEAHTAYGALVPVPGNVDVLIAGTSCVDYSNLNNEKQDIDANGESGRTFRGMMSWVCNHRPPLVILENVCNAPWKRVQEKFEAHGYSASFLRVDTKYFYIPHTRTRVYLLAVDKKGSSIPDKWSKMITDLKRGASSTLDSFLLPSDDPRIHLARQKLVRESYNALDRKTGRTDWGRCESRHQRARLEEALGAKRPLTSWDEGGFCKLPDYAWNDWGVGQVERVWDLMDISLLRSAVKGVDPSYKTLVWNLSQNVDRTIGSSRLGICPCLTPSMIPYITNRGGPMVGLEALSMQGLPVDKLLLTRETEDQLADLAGNAMSTTVVGACILVALVTGQKLLKAGNDNETYESKNGIDYVEDSTAMEVDEPVEDANVAAHIAHSDLLDYSPLDLSTTNAMAFDDLLIHARRSARLCSCEGRADMTTRELIRCSDCGNTSCTKCGGRPEHNPQPIDTTTEPRLPPTEFSKALRSTLPMCISLMNVNRELLENLKVSAGLKILGERWKKWSEAVLRAADSTLRFVELKRQEIWSAVYQSSHGMLELLLHPQAPEWRLYAFAEEHEAANAEIRRLLESPVGRFTCQDGLLMGKWEFAFPFATVVSVKSKGSEELVPSWESRLGLITSDHKDKKVHASLDIQVQPQDVVHFDRDISGTYVLLEKCGTANGALHKRIEKDEHRPPIYMLFDPQRTSDDEDAFVFTTSTRRYEFGETRPVLAKLDASWRQSNADEEDVHCQLPLRWLVADDVRLQASISKPARFGKPNGELTIDASNEVCSSAQAFLVCTVDLDGHAGPEWPQGSWQEVDKIHERGTFKSLAWLLERVQHVDDRFSTWQSTSCSGNHSNCERCAPSAPKIEWVRTGSKIVPVEDPVQAGEYERRLKRRPSPFVTQLMLGEDGLGTVRIGINVPSLLHRALSRLPSTVASETPSLSWRLQTNFVPAATQNFTKFTIMSNKRDVEHAQPPHFKTPLRKEQLRSLSWMIAQESINAPVFKEEEISEAMLEPLGWRVEARAQREIRMRGGVLADQVGYGKTAITLGLIDCTAKDIEKEYSDLPANGKIPLKATVVIVPPHLTRQWDSEVRKFIKAKLNVLVLTTAANLNSSTISDFQNADIVIVASNLFKSSVYLDNLQLLAACGDLPSKEGRHFNDQLSKMAEALKVQTDRLRSDGSLAVLTAIKDGQKNVADQLEAARLQTKRLKGKSYRDAADKQELLKTNKVPGRGLEAMTLDEAEPEAKPSKRKQLAKRTPSGLIPEVVITTRRSSTTSTARSSPAHSDEQDSDSEVPKPIRKRRAVTRKSIVISDDEDSGEENLPSKQSKKPSRLTSKPKGKKKKIAKRFDDDDDDDDFIDDEGDGSTGTEESVSDVSSGEEEARSKKTKEKPSKTTFKPQRSYEDTITETTASSDMDVDEPAPKKGIKRKAQKGEEGPPSKKQKRTDADPWKLASRVVQSDWTEMKAPPLEMFHFSRKVVDEYTYLDGKVLSLITNLTAERLWVLSGTPPIHDFGALKTISAFLNIHLGVDDDMEGKSAEVKRRRREQTDVEKFHSFREVHTGEWHAHRHELGQIFLDQFVRQNIAEIDEIPWTDSIVPITLPAAERAIYLELEHHLRALDMTIKRGKKTESDREKRLAKSLGDSKSAEEALLKRCSHFDLETSNENAMKACDVIVKERQKQLDDCLAELLAGIKQGVKREDDLEKRLKGRGDQSLFHEWIQVCRAGEIDDQEASELVVDLIDNQAKVQKFKTKKKDDVLLSEKDKQLIWEHREKTHELRRLTKEVVGRVRSLRYFSIVRDLQKQTETPPSIACPGCGQQDVPLEEAAVLSSCGHTGCLACVKSCAEQELCVYAASGACKSAARVLNIVMAVTLGVDDMERDGRGKHFGTKLEQVVHLIKRIPENERVLVFVQFPDLMKKVTEALTANKIEYLEIKGTASMKSKNLEKFQNGSEERVLLLSISDESASGANLTSANHAIFLSPLLADSEEKYKATETQAIGRLVRYGQEKHVHLHRFITSSTIDEEIFEQRKSTKTTGSL